MLERHSTRFLEIQFFINVLAIKYSARMLFLTLTDIMNIIKSLLLIVLLIVTAKGQPVPSPPKDPKPLETPRVIFSPVSIWQPFCDEKLLFEPYVNIWSGEEERTFVKGRGPGFIDVRDMNDIYVCTNGIVMMYYANTHEMGDIFEEGELRWAPHYCQLHNPTCGPGKLQPRKHLKAILLIGHPKDYRNPALQMFVSPYYKNGTLFSNTSYEAGWYNLTSYLMINDMSECIVERGVEKALIRININPPKYKDEFEPDPQNPTKYLDKRQSFCKFDAGRMLGQLHEFAELQNSKHEIITRETVISQWYFDHFVFRDPSRFLGCLRYPVFNQKMYEIIMNNYWIKNDPLNSTIKIVPIADIDEFNPKKRDNKSDEEFPFWHAEVNGKKRFEWIAVTEDPDKDFDGAPNASAKYEEKHKKFLEAKKNHTADNATIEEEFKAYLQYQLYPFRKEYHAMYTTATTKMDDIASSWKAASQDITDCKLQDFLKTADEAMKNRSLLYHQMRVNPYDNSVKADYDNAQKEVDTAFEGLDNCTAILGRHVSEAEVVTSNYRRFKDTLASSGRKLRSAWATAEKRKEAKYRATKLPITDHNLSLSNREKDGLNYTGCDYLAGRSETCHNIRPSSNRSHTIYLARIGRGLKWEKEEDEWRDIVLDLIADIFAKTCPYIRSVADMATGVNRVMKAYLMKEPNGTGFEVPFRGARLYGHINVGGEEFLKEVYEDTRDSMGEKLGKRRKFWDYIIRMLQQCKGSVDRIMFVKGNDDTRIPLLKRFDGDNGTFDYIPVDQLHMVEQADREYVFNWVVDTNWKMFAAVLGSCIRSYSDKVPLMAAQFYSLYFEDFLHPVRQIWMSHRDNPIFRYIFGNFYGGRAEKWLKYCMEASFINAEEMTYRPLRWLLVNQFSELNFFATGPMAGSSGFYFSENEH